MEVVLVTCVIFFYAELILGNAQKALQHLRSGTRILCDWKRSYEGKRRRSCSNALRELIDDNITPIFEYLNCASFITGIPKRAEQITAADYVFHSMQEAVDSFERLMDLVDRFTSAMHKLTTWSTTNEHSKFVPDNLLLFKYKLLLRAQQWIEALASLKERTGSTNDIVLLESQHRIATIRISKAFDGSDEMSWDLHLRDFEKFVYTADTMLSGIESKVDASGVKSDCTVCPRLTRSLYITAVKCRNPRLQRRALALLERSLRTGYTFEKIGRMAYQVDRLVVLEEGGLEDLIGLNFYGVTGQDLLASLDKDVNYGFSCPDHIYHSPLLR